MADLLADRLRHGDRRRRVFRRSLCFARMDTDRARRALEHADDQFTRSRSMLFAALCRRAADDPEILSLAAEIPRGQLVGPLLMSAVHFELLGAPEHELAGWFASICPDPLPPESAYPAFSAFCREHRDAIAHPYTDADRNADHDADADRYDHPNADADAIAYQCTDGDADALDPAQLLVPGHCEVNVRHPHSGRFEWPAGMGCISVSGCSPRRWTLQSLQRLAVARSAPSLKCTRRNEMIRRVTNACGTIAAACSGEWKTEAKSCPQQKRKTR